MQAAAAEDAAVDETPEGPVQDAAWCQRCTAGNWIIKREEESAKRAEIAA